MTAEGGAGGDQGEVTIYTDGGAEPNPGTGGWGVVLVHPASGKTKELSGGEAKTTNNRMELTAAIRALESLKGRCKVKLYTDSQYLRRGITEWLPKWRRQGWKRKGGAPVLNADLWKELASCTDRHEVSWKWVKGHAGNRHNEQADALATKAIRAQRKKSGQPDPAEQPLPQADFEVFLKVSGGPRGGWAAIVRQGEEEEFLGGASEGATSNLLDVMAAAEILDRLPPKASVAFVTVSDYLRNGATQWIRGWSRKGWKTASGSPVKNAHAWRRLEAALRRRKVIWPNVKGRKMLEMKALEKRLKERAE